MNNYVTEYIFLDDIGLIKSSPSNLFYGGVALFVIGCFMLAYLQWKRKKVKSIVKKETYLFPLACLPLGLILFVIGINDDSDKLAEYLISKYEKKDYSVQEGQVFVLKEEPFNGRAGHGDIVRIGNAEFELYYYKTSVGYTKTIAHGGILSEGKDVRIYYVDDFILRIDVKQE